MSIDMQFSFLSNDLASAKQAESKVRGTDGGCGDKGFGDVFEEQLQQAAESDAEQKAKNLLTGQEVAAMLNNTLPDTDTVDIAAIVGSGEPTDSAQSGADVESSISAQLIKHYQSSDTTAETLPSGEDAASAADERQATLSAANGSLNAKESDSLFHLIAKARDYAAELETGEGRKEMQSGVAALSAQAALKSVGIAEDHGAPLIAEPEASELAEFMLLSAEKDGSAQQADTATDPALAAELTKTSAAVKQALAEAEQATAAESLASAAEQQTPQTSGSAAEKLTPEQQAIGPKTESLRQLLRQAESADAEPTTTAAESQAGTSPQQPLTTEQGAAVITVADAAGAEKNQVSTAMAATPALLQGTGNPTAEQAEATLAVTEQAELSGALLTPALNASGSGKNNKTATAGFAEFQKAANAALAQQQKQQTETQQQSGQQDAVQSEGTAPDLMFVQPGVVSHDQPQLASTLVATEKALAGGFSQTGSQSGGHSGSQSQQSFSQILATKQLDSQTQNLPSLSLLEPTAANQLKERVMFQVNQKIQSADIRLAPEELGSVQIKINLQQEQLSVQFVVQQSAAKEALEQQMPRLKELLQEQGMALTDGQVHQQQQEQQSQQDDRRTATGRTGGHTTADDEAEVAAQQVQVSVSDRMVDYYA